MNGIEVKGRLTVKRRLYVNFNHESEENKNTSNRPPASCPKALRKIQSVYVNNSLRENSFSKIFKKKKFFNRVESLNKITENEEIGETSLDKKIKYFYSPYNRRGDYSKHMKFECEEHDMQSPIQNTANQTSQWK